MTAQLQDLAEARQFNAVAKNATRRAQIFRLLDEGDLSTAEIAERLSCGVSTVKQARVDWRKERGL